MRIGILNELSDDRVVLLPPQVQALADKGHTCLVETGAGKGALVKDEEYQAAGAQLLSREEVLKQANLIISIHPLQSIDEEPYKPDAGCWFISSFRPYENPGIAETFRQNDWNGFSLDMLPRTTLAQDKDVLSSMASVAGYRAVIEAAGLLPRYFPMLSTAAGSIPPAKVLVLGAGVAGLQAIATAKRLGASVEAFDTRIAAGEEVRSLGAKFVEVPGSRDDKGAGGYAVEQTEEYKQKQKELVHERIVRADVVITTALLRGKPAPKLVTEEMVKAMSPGSVIMDLAAAGGGNCALTENGKTVRKYGVTIVGDSKLESRMPVHASQLYSKNVFNFLKVLFPEDPDQPDMENPLVKETSLLKQGETAA